ncbi:cytochrome-c oxidase [Ammoniphilus sp. CFH 90114]|uniref:cytochrome-c oxidase n=1 Tax=Ammoniphilus sp. CFH 90114 TaxID=2493665 RepID=UPI00100DFC03|nr:cytochrome-c oxidase [Ammoniphilus sp. CFH 90114]RXT03999.1 cytochrome-c oxidase [Ammoniphilus sp. CFH 90114]
MHTWFLKLAAGYFVIGVLVGMGMSMTHQFGLVSLHAHINLLGWMSMALFGIIYHLYPATAESTLFRWHFWLYNIGLPIMMVALYLVLTGVNAALPFIPVGATAVIIGVIVFAVNLWRNIKA